MTLDEAINRAREIAERQTDDAMRAATTDALLQGADPDLLDAQIEAGRRETSRLLEAALRKAKARIEADLAAFPQGGRRMFRATEIPGPRGATLSARPNS